MENRKMSIAFYTLGCKVNQYETQGLKEEFAKRGFGLAAEDEAADIYVVNTCTVTNLADRKSRQYIRRMKKYNPNSIIAVIGCYAQVSPGEAASIEGVDLVLGNNEKNQLPDYIEKLLINRSRGWEAGQEESPFVKILDRDELTEYEECGTITSMESRTRAYIKIQDGCDRFCSYCIIPYARGPIRSRPLEDIAKEAETLINKGFKELILTGINTALYGAEKDQSYNIENVIGLLDAMEGDFRIRLGSLEPNVIDADLAKSLLKYKKLCPHMHLSIQSGSDRILRAMNRNYNKDEYLKIVGVLREHDNNYGITTDIIVGFPGESPEDLETGKNLIKDVGFVKTHIFPYSKRQGTKAADMEGHLDNSTKKFRAAELSKVGHESAKEFLKKNIGSVREVLFEEYDEETGMISGYSDNYIKTYYPVENAQIAGKMLNKLHGVKFVELYDDGIKGKEDKNE